MYRRPRIKLGYHTFYKIDVYCFFSEGDRPYQKLQWATEEIVMNQPYRGLPTIEIPRLASCFGQLDPLYAPFDQVLAGINLKMAAKNIQVRKEISTKLKEWYLKARGVAF
jgi:hypothetical protein